MRKSLIVLAGLSIVLSCLVASERLAPDKFEKFQNPPSQPRTATLAAQKEKMKVIRKLKVRVTAYYGPKHNQKEYVLGSYKRDVRMNGAGKETRSGTKPRIGTAAADWRILGKGTKFRIPKCAEVLGKRKLTPTSKIIFTVEDTGSGVKGRHVDIFTGFGDHGRKLAENFNNKRSRYVIEIVKRQLR